MQTFRKIQWIVIENFPDARTHARARVNSKVPIPTQVWGPKIQEDKNIAIKHIIGRGKIV